MASEKQAAFFTDLLAKTRMELQREVGLYVFRLGVPTLDAFIVKAAEGKGGSAESQARGRVALALFDELVPSVEAFAALDGKAASAWIDCLKKPVAVSLVVKAYAYTTGQGKARFGWNTTEPSEALQRRLLELTDRETGASLLEGATNA